MTWQGLDLARSGRPLMRSTLLHPADRSVRRTLTAVIAPAPIGSTELSGVAT